MATPRTLLALAPALLAATLAAQSPGGRTPVASGRGAVPGHGHILPPHVPTYTVIEMATLSDQNIIGTAFDLDPSFDPNFPTSKPVMVGGSATDFVPYAPGVLVSLNRAVGYFSSSVVLDLGVMTVSEAHGMNSHGTVVGFAGTDLIPDKAFRYAHGSWTILPGLGGPDTNAMAVNSHDIVVGYKSSGWGHSTALYWTPDDQVHALATGAFSSELSDINDEDIVAGYLRDSSSSPDLAFKMKVDGSGPTLLPAPFAVNGGCWAEAINDGGDVVGESSLYGAMQPVLWSHGAAIPLPVIPNEGTGGARANDINNRGVIVGSSNWGKAVVWIHGAVYDPNTLTPDYAPFLKNARAINDQGVIACESDAGATRAVLLIPNP